MSVRTYQAHRRMVQEKENQLNKKLEALKIRRYALIGFPKKKKQRNKLNQQIKKIESRKQFLYQLLNAKKTLVEGLNEISTPIYDDFMPNNVQLIKRKTEIQKEAYKISHNLVWEAESMEELEPYETKLIIFKKEFDQMRNHPETDNNYVDKQNPMIQLLERDKRRAEEILNTQEKLHTILTTRNKNGQHDKELKELEKSIKVERKIAKTSTRKQMKNHFPQRFSSDVKLSWFRKCDFCQIPMKNWKRCENCLNARYCSKKCQRKDWSNHRKKCKPAKAGNNCLNKTTVIFFFSILAFWVYYFSEN